MYLSIVLHYYLDKFALLCHYYRFIDINWISIISKINIEYIQRKIWIAIYTGWLEFMRGAKIG